MASMKWTEEKVIAAVRERYKSGLPLNYIAVLRNNCPLVKAGERRFGSWDGTLAAAGLDPALIKFPPVEKEPPGSWTPERVLRMIREDIDAGLDVSSKAAKMRCSSLVARGCDYFGSWAAAIEAAGYDYEKIRRGGRTRTPEDVIERIRTLAELRADLSARTCSAYQPGLYSSAQVHFGGWPQALKAAGMDPSQAERAVRWSRRHIIAAILQGSQHRSLRHAARREFGSWEKACRAAGIADDAEQSPCNRIKERRTELGLTQEELGAQIGVTGGMVYCWESGVRPDPRVSMALRIARALECRVEDIYSENPEKPASQNDAGDATSNPLD